MAIDPRLREAAEHLKSGRDREAASACQEVLGANAEEPAALHLLGVALTRLAQPAEAIAYLERAAQRLPDSAAVQLDLGNAWRRGGHRANAQAAYERALERDPAHPGARFQLAASFAEEGRPGEAARHFGRVARANPLDFEAAQRYVDCVAAMVRTAGADGSWSQPEEARPLASVAVGFCTRDERRAAAARASLERALAPAACTFHIVRDARSLAEAYNRILDEARAEVVILCHDDIEILTPRLDRVLANALATVDIVGVAGSDRVAGPAVLWAGHPHVHGWVSYPRGEAGYEAAPLSLRAGLLTGMQALDGCFVAMRGEAAARVRFDAATFDGFHFYDLDFTYRAWKDGLRLAVTTDALVLHASEGRFDEAWARYRDRFREKFPQLAAKAGSPHWYGARFASKAELLAFYGRLRDDANNA